MSRCFFLILFTLCLYIPVALSQANKPVLPRDSAIIRLFEKPTEIKWVRNFKGRIDDVSSVEVSLGFDGRQCKGYLTYPKSKVRFKLEGTLPDSNHLKLEERDMTKQVTGRLEGRIAGRRLEADWTNAANSLGARLEADDLPPGMALPPCGDNKWTNRYIGRFNNGRIDLVLSRMHNGYLNGYMWIEADNKTYLLRGDSDAKGDFVLPAILPGGKEVAKLRGNLKNPQALICKWTGTGEQREFNLIPREHLVMGCIENADYTSSIDALYPRLANCNTCNVRLDQLVNDWVKRCNTTLAGQKDPLAPANRARSRASAWAEVLCWTETVFSGCLHFSDAWSPLAQGQAFNFDLRTGKEIRMEDLFNKSFDWKKWMEEYARKESPKMTQFAADPKYREWLAANGFPLITIRRDGLLLSTCFHPDYGRQFLVVPYNELKPFLKKDNPINDLIR